MILSSLDGHSNAHFSPDDLAECAEEEVQALIDCELLRETTPARSVICDGCEEACLADVKFVDYGAGPPSAYVVCDLRDDIGVVPVPLDRLRRWQTTGEGLARVVAGLLNTDREIEECLRGRLWWLGRPDIAGRPEDAFVALGAANSDARTLFSDAGRLRECAEAVVLCTRDVPALSPFGPDAKALSLARLLLIRDGALALDRAEIAAHTTKSKTQRTQTVVPLATPAGATWEKILIEFCNDEHVKVATGSATDHRDFVQMGFRDRRKSADTPDTLWYLLKLMARHDGELGWDDEASTNQVDRTKVPKYVSDLRKRLRALFPGISDDPFHPYKKFSAYKTRFVLCCSEQYRRSSR